MGRGILEDPVLDIEENVTMIQEQFKWREPDIKSTRISRKFSGQETETNSNDKVAVGTSENGVVAADHETCSKIGAEVLELLGAFCLGVLNPSSSGIGGGAFMVVGSGDSVAKAYDMRETAPLAASQNMFENREAERVVGALSIAVPGEIAGLYKAWERHGRVPWKRLVEPSIKLAREGFEVGSHLAFALSKNEAMIKNDIGLKSVFTNGD
ncbi:Glutathione hydrolase 3 [Cardamine amara subsp. amara]|uniref:Glutathione hydrolase 3 n=1 Tax=Cardamine amara subsp. amara TaxID=228776 RepID=A0ABD1AV76_CARAN